MLLFEPDNLPGAPRQHRARALSNQWMAPGTFVVDALMAAGRQLGVMRSTINQSDNQGVVVSSADEVAIAAANADTVPRPATAPLAGTALLIGGLASAGARCRSTIAD